MGDYIHYGTSKYAFSVLAWNRFFLESQSLAPRLRDHLFGQSGREPSSRTNSKQAIVSINETALVIACPLGFSFHYTVKTDAYCSLSFSLGFGTDAFNTSSNDVFIFKGFSFGFLSLSLFISQIYSIDIENYPIFDNPP